ncbi:plasmid recombination protein [Enterococcus hirae]
MKLEKTDYRFYELEQVQRHNQREIVESSIVQPDKTSLNYDVLNKKFIDYKKIIRKYLTHLSSTKSIHSNWTILIEWRIIFKESALKKLSVRETKLFFLQIVQTFQKLYGLSNIIYAHVHFDEEKPHLHIGLIPMKEGRLNSAYIMSKYKNCEIETELLKKLEAVLQQNKTSIYRKKSTNDHMKEQLNAEYQEYKELYTKLLHHSLLPSEVGMKKPGRETDNYSNHMTDEKSKTIDELHKENNYLNSLVKRLKAENNYLLNVMKETKNNFEQLDKHNCSKNTMNEPPFAKLELENRNY